MSPREPTLDDLRAEAAYRDRRLALYRARVYAARPTSATRLRELERASAGATERLRRAERAQQPQSPGRSTASVANDTIGEGP
jgi:DNA-binding PucR family transcriptional regulator